ncbi:MAG: hypothetical protein HY231_02955 [Acidobacteria bacterium]|nr:hypothetical protein [Acidobacteriota bacterium]
MDKVGLMHQLIQEQLTHEEQQELVKRLGLGDQAFADKIIIRIHDTEGECTKSPKAEIRLPDGTTNSIDIFKTVETNHASIGHPAVLCAINRWHHIIRVYTRMPDNIHNYLRDQRNFDSRKLRGTAQKHLEKLSLILGKNRKYLTKEDIYSLCGDRLYADHEEILAEAFGIFREVIKIKRTKTARLDALECELAKRRHSHWLLLHLRETQELNREDKEILQEQGAKDHELQTIIRFFKDKHDDIVNVKNNTPGARKNLFLAWLFKWKRSTFKSYGSRRKTPTEKLNFHDHGILLEPSPIYFGNHLEALGNLPISYTRLEGLLRSANYWWHLPTCK